MHQNNLIPSDAVAVTASDSTAVDFVGLYVGTAGNVAVKGVGGTAVTFKNAPAGMIIPMRIVTVMTTNTTASDLVGFIA